MMERKGDFSGRSQSIADSKKDLNDRKGPPREETTTKEREETLKLPNSTRRPKSGKSL